MTFNTSMSYCRRWLSLSLFPSGDCKGSHPDNDVDCGMPMSLPSDGKIKQSRDQDHKAPTLQFAATNANAHEKATSRVSGSLSRPTISPYLCVYRCRVAVAVRTLAQTS